MKCFAILLTILFSSILSQAQTLVVHQVGNPPKALRVWLPKGYSKKNRYPLLLVIDTSYDELVARTAAHYIGQLRRLPPVIVVGVAAEAEEMGFSYETGGVNQKGKHFSDYLLKELLTFLESQYPLASFRGVMGHSYGANYTDYLATHFPGKFDGYALITPEMPQYKLEVAKAIRSGGKPVYYYVASGELDLDRRQEHARSIAAQFKSLRREEGRFTYDQLAGADHLTAVPRAIPAALESLFFAYSDLEYPDSKPKLIPWFEGLKAKIEGLFGSGILKDSTNAVYFCSLAVEQKSVEDLNYFAEHFLTGNPDASVLFNTGQYYMMLNEVDRAIALYERAIRRARATKRNDFLLMSHRTLGLTVYSRVKKDPARAWKALEAGYKEMKDPAFKFFFGLVSSAHSYRLDDGIKYLKEFETERTQSLFGSLYSLDLVYVTLAQCHQRKGDNQTALTYVDKALRIDPSNETALALRKELGG